MIDLADNINHWGPAPAALRVLRTAGPELLASYPTPAADHLRAALARQAGVREVEVATGCGSDDVIDAVLRGLARPGDALAFSEPTFSVIPGFARRCGLQAVAVPFDPGGGVEPERLLRTGARLLYVCAPNNPTGAGVPAPVIDELCRRHRGVIILDEAYVEFAGPSLAASAPQRTNLVVVRTLSKAYGLAGLRVGWAVACRGLTSRIDRARGPYKVGALAERVALAALGEAAHVQATVAAAVEARERLRTELTGRGLRPLPSLANFLLVPVADAYRLAGQLSARGVKVRPLPALPGIGDAVRIGVAPWPLLQRLLEALDAEGIRCA